MNTTRFKTLMDRYIAGELDDDEWSALAEMVRTGQYDALLQQQIEDIYHAEEGTEDMALSRRQELLYRIYAETAPQQKVRRLPVHWWAAAVLVLVLAGGYFFMKQDAPVPVTVSDNKVPVKKETDVLPGSNKAMLTLSDGSVITLDSAGRQVLHQGNTAIRRQNGQLQYVSSHTSREVRYNTLTTPKGGQYRLLLPDSTAVWLNAASSIRYPVAFTGHERRVVLTGEAYFEVAPDSRKPFRIQVADQVVEVLGTHFNINAYADEPEIRTSLLEGAVKVGRTVLKPGEQAHVNREGGITVTREENIMDAVAWKNGFFVFRDDNLRTVMREIARWYDVTIIYQPDVNNNQQFSGRIDRNLTLSQVLSGLAQTKARFSIEEDRKVVILP